MERQQLFNLAPDASVGIGPSEIPVQTSLGQAFSRKHRTVVERDTPLMLRNQLVHVKRAVHRLDVNFASISRHRCNADVLVAFMSSPAWDGVVTLCERNNPLDVPPPAENAFQLLADTGCAPYPRFPVKLSGFRELHAPFLNERRTRGRVRCSEAGNPGISIRDQDSGSGWGSYAPVGMTSSLLTFRLSTDS